jgi:hypothetical protein
MKFPKNFPDILDGANILFASCTKCNSGVYDSDTRKIIPYQFYALARFDNNSDIHVFSVNEDFEVIADLLCSTIEYAMSEMEPEGIYKKDWKKIKLQTHKKSGNR